MVLWVLLRGLLGLLFRRLYNYLDPIPRVPSVFYLTVSTKHHHKRHSFSQLYPTPYLYTAC